MNFNEDVTQQNKRFGVVYGGVESDNERKIIYAHTHKHRRVFRKCPRTGATSVTERKPTC